jgi:hypothetical protein
MIYLLVQVVFHDSSSTSEVFFLGDGFAIELSGTIYEFKTAERAPPEGIATAGYVVYVNIS